MSEGGDIVLYVAERRANQYRVDGWNAIADAIDRFAIELVMELDRRAPVQPEQPDAHRCATCGRPRGETSHEEMDGGFCMGPGDPGCRDEQPDAAKKGGTK